MSGRQPLPYRITEALPVDRGQAGPNLFAEVVSAMACLLREAIYFGPFARTPC
jgi:hypothetical protein